MYLQTLNVVRFVLATKEIRDDQEKRGDEWVKNGKKVNWYKLLFKDEFSNLYEVNSKENEDILKALPLEGKDGFIQYKLSYYQGAAKIKFAAFVPTKK